MSIIDGNEGKPKPNLTEEQQKILDGLIDPDVKSPPKFHWDENHQRRILGAILMDKEFMQFSIPLVEPLYFTNQAHSAISRSAFEYFMKYKDLPDEDITWQMVEATIKAKDDAVKLYYRSEIRTVREFYVPGLATRQYIREQILDFNKCQRSKIIMAEWMDAITKAKDRQAADNALTIALAGMRGLMRDAGVSNGVRILNAAELLALPDPDWLADEHFQMNSTALIYGEYGSLKSFMAVELALCVATGLPFLGKYPVKQGPVAYIAGEGEHGMKQRVQAWLKHHNVSPPAGLHVIPHRFDLGTKGESSKLLMALEERNISPVLVQIDTLAKNIAGSDNDPAIMNNASNALEDIREATGACVIAVHHAGKDRSRGPRGYSGLACGVNTAFELDRTDTGCMVRCEKQKDAEEIEKYNLDSQVIDLGFDAKGRPVSSLVLIGAKPKPPEANTQRAEEWDNKQAIISVLSQSEQEGIDAADIIDKTGLGKNKVYKALEELKASSGVLRWKPGGGNKSTIYWRDFVS